MLENLQSTGPNTNIAERKITLLAGKDQLDSNGYLPSMLQTGEEI